MNEDDDNVDSLIAQWTLLAAQNNTLAAKLIDIFDETNRVQSEKRRVEADLFKIQKDLLDHRKTEFPFKVELNLVNFLDTRFGVPISPNCALNTEIDAFIEENGGCDVLGTKAMMRSGHVFFFRDAQVAMEFKLRFG